MDKNFEKFKKQIIKEAKKIKPEVDYSGFGLKFNPFPPAAVPRFPLPPLDEEVMEKIVKFIQSTYFSQRRGEYAGLTIIGDFGMGKTHIMKFIQFLIDTLTNDEKIPFSAVTTFVDRPEDSPQRVVHKIVEQVGLDNIRKYIWIRLINEFQKDLDAFYNKFKSKQLTLLDSSVNDWKKLFEEPVKSNYLQFLKLFRNMNGDIKLLQESAREIIKNEKIVEDSVLADRYLDLIFEEKKAGTSWDILAGYVSNRSVQSKEIAFLNSIVRILRNEGFRLLYVFVDEFEDISKLKGVKLTNYLLTLNTLINKERNWALVVSLTRDALMKIKEESPPLYDRLTSYKVELQPLTEKKANKLLINYLNLVREREKEDCFPFSTEAIKKMLDISKGNHRSFVRFAHQSIEHMAINKIKPPINEKVIEEMLSAGYE